MHPETPLFAHSTCHKITKAPEVQVQAAMFYAYSKLELIARQMIRTRRNDNNSLVNLKDKGQ